jgi:hypothetical protein
MTPHLVDRVMLSLTDEPTKAEVIAKRANLGICQTYQALVRLYDSGRAFIARGSGNDHHCIEGWQR